MAMTSPARAGAERPWWLAGVLLLGMLMALDFLLGRQVNGAYGAAAVVAALNADPRRTAAVAALALVGEQARAQGLPVHLVRGDALAMPFRDGAFAVVFHQGLLEHFRDPMPLLRENARVTRPSGRVVVDVPQTLHLYTVMKKILIALDAWFAGWAPARDPEIAIIVLIEHGGPGAHHDYLLPQYDRLARGRAEAVAVDEPRLSLSDRLIEELAKRAPEGGADILIQVNVADEESKYGVSEEEVGELLDAAAQTGGRVRARGFMTLAPLVDDPEDVRHVFAKLRTIRDSLRKSWSPHFDLSELSMGMSGDYAIAVEEGSSMVRIGSLLFGARNYAK